MPRPRRHCVRWGPNCPKGAPAPPKGHSGPQFSAHVCCGQTAEWIKMPLGTEVGLGPGHSVLDGDPAPPRKGAQQPRPLFLAHVYCGQTAGWINMIKMPLGAEVGGRPLPRPRCVRWGSSPPPKEAQQPRPLFRPMCLVAKRLDGSRCHLVRS